MDFLFDIGRVLLDFDFESSLVRLLPGQVEDAEERLKVLLERKDDFEAGRIPEEEYVAWAIERLGGGIEPEAFRRAWRYIFTPNEPMWQVVETLAAAGHRLILFSNTNAIHMPWLYGEYPGFGIFQGAVFSHEARSIKPEEAIYEYAIREYGLDPSETLYVDDLGPNIETGKRFGFRSWQYDLRKHEEFLIWLRSEMPGFPG